MKTMKKYLMAVISLCLCAVIICGCLAETVEAKKQKVIVYTTWGDITSKFSVKDGRLTVKTTWPFNKNGKETKKKKLSYPLAKNCKWEEYGRGEKLEYLGKSSYKKLKKEIKEQYTISEKYGSYDSPTAIDIVIKNKKVVKVKAIYS